MHVPERAEAAEAREAKAGGAEFLRDIPGDVDPDHVKRDSPGARAVEGRDAMADLLEIDAEPVPQEVQVVALVLRGAEERLVGRQDGAGEIVGQRDAAEGSRSR